MQGALRKSDGQAHSVILIEGELGIIPFGRHKAARSRAERASKSNQMYCPLGPRLSTIFSVREHVRHRHDAQETHQLAALSQCGRTRNCGADFR